MRDIIKAGECGFCIAGKFRSFFIKEVEKMWKSPVVEVIDLTDYEGFAISSLGQGCDRIRCCY